MFIIDLPHQQTWARSPKKCTSNYYFKFIIDKIEDFNQIYLEIRPYVFRPIRV